MSSQSAGMTLQPQTSELARRLRSIADGDEGYWSFVDRDEREHVHLLFQYPAMMVPLMQRKLIETFLDWDPSIRTIYDPFTGSGTVMTETMLRGLDFFGTDINPLAILVAQAKSETFDTDVLETELHPILEETSHTRSVTELLDFVNITKWFEPEVIRKLSILRSSIKHCRSRTVRCFCWVALAETVRLTSNSRTSTVKLHIRPDSEIEKRPDPISLFHEIARRNLRVLKEQREVLAGRQLLINNRYTGHVQLKIADVRHPVWDTTADMIITSPPYGDNHTTVTYGQASYLPLQWIDRSDIADLPTDELSECIKNTHRLDTSSLGGSRATYRQRSQHFRSLVDRSPHLRHVKQCLRGQHEERWKRVITFYADLDQSIDTIIKYIRPNGILAWTTGDRTVGGIRIPMGSIVTDLLGDRIEMVTSLQRTIPATRKRMAPRNGSSATVRNETILVMRRAEAR